MFVPVVAALQFGDVVGWIGVAGTIVVAVLLIVPPVWVSADVDPTWQVQAHLKLLRPWPRHVTMLQPIKGMPSLFDRWFGRRHLRAEELSVIENELQPNEALDGFLGVKLYVIDLKEQPKGTEVAVVVKCGSRSRYARATRYDRPFHYGTAAD